MRSYLIFGTFLLLCLFPCALWADECHLTEVASLNITPTADGRILIPVKLQGISEMMMVDTGAPATVIDPGIAASLQLKTELIGQGQIFTSRGLQFTQKASISDFGLDHSHATGVQVLVNPYQLSEDRSVAGLLGADLLRHYDIEVDFAARKLNLFSQDHCDGQVIYWPASVVAVVPIHVALSGHILMTVQLDGKSFDAVFDTGSSTTAIDAKAAYDMFGLMPKSPGMQKENFSDGEEYYKHVFNTLDFEGIAIAHPEIVIWENRGERAAKNTPGIGTRIGETSEAYGQAPMIVGMREMDHLHMFLSYKEQKLYVTPAQPAGPTTALAR